MKKLFLLNIVFFLGYSFLNNVQALPLKIGYITDLSGRGAFMGAQTQRGALLAKDKIQQNGEKIQIIFEDTQGETKNAITAVVKLIELEKVDSIICDLTPICTAISPKVQSAQKPLIYISPSELIGKDNKFALRNFIDYRVGCNAAVEKLKSNGISKIATINVNMEFGEICEDGAKQAANSIVTWRYNSGEDTSSGVTLMKAKGISAFVFTGYEKDFIQWIKFCRQQELKIPFVVPDVYLSQTAREAVGDMINNAYTFGYNKLPAWFEDAIVKKFGSDAKINMQGAGLAYNAVMQLNYAYKECNAGKNIDCLMDKLRDSPQSTLLGFKGWKMGQSEFEVLIDKPMGF